MAVLVMAVLVMAVLVTVLGVLGRIEIIDARHHCSSRVHAQHVIVGQRHGASQAERTARQGHAHHMGLLALEPQPQGLIEAMVAFVVTAGHQQPFAAVDRLAQFFLNVFVELLVLAQQRVQSVASGTQFTREVVGGVGNGVRPAGLLEQGFQECALRDQAVRALRSVRIAVALLVILARAAALPGTVEAVILVLLAVFRRVEQDEQAAAGAELELAVDFDRRLQHPESAESDGAQKPAVLGLDHATVTAERQPTGIDIAEVAVHHASGRQVYDFTEFIDHRAGVHVDQLMYQPDSGERCGRHVLGDLGA